MELQSHIDGRRRDEDGLPLQASLFSVFLCILFGGNAAAMKISLVGLGPFTNAGLRFGVAVCLIIVWGLCTGKPLLVKKKQFARIAVIGPIFFAQLSLFYIGMSKTSASHGTLVSNMLPFVVMVLAHFFIPGDRIQLKKLFGLVFGFCGVAILFSDGAIGGDMFEGDLYILMAVLFWGANAVYTKRIIADIYPFQMVLYPMAIAVPCFLVCGFIMDDVMIGAMTTEIVAALFYQTCITASFGMVAWTSMIKKYGATSLHAFVFIMPLSGVFLGVVLLGEPVTAQLVIAMILVMAGLLVVNRPRPVNMQRKP